MKPNDPRSRPISLPTMLCFEARSKPGGSRYRRCCARILHRREPAKSSSCTGRVLRRGVKFDVQLRHVAR